VAGSTKKSNVSKSQGTLVGTDVLGLITTGIHTNPLILYREYIQNAADAIEGSPNQKTGKVEIFVDTKGRNITIRDTGPGLSHQRAKDALVPIARSDKKKVSDRGFRGIGRLSGLAFSQSVTFLTRDRAKIPVTQVIWKGEELRRCIQEGFSLEETILQCVNIEKIEIQDVPDHFFEVRIEGIHRQAASSVLNINTVRDYLGETCPVPFSDRFPYKRNISNIFSKKDAPFELEIFLGRNESHNLELDGAAPINRRHNTHVSLSAERTDNFIELETIDIPAISGESPAARGWIAHTSYQGALLNQSGIRGLRARMGNIQIGNETVFDHLFSETRFNRWCVGELHILDRRVVPNGTRDYFEMNIHLRNLENYLIVLCRNIEQRCRIASKTRNSSQKYRSFLEDIEATHELVSSGYLSKYAARRLIQNTLSNIRIFRQKDMFDEADEQAFQLSKLEQKLNTLDLPDSASGELAQLSKSKITVCRSVFSAITRMYPSSKRAKETIESILKHMETRNDS